METTCMSFNGWMDKKKCETCIYNGILLGNKRNGVQLHGWTLKTLCWVKEARRRRPHVVWFHVYEMPRTGKSIETESRVVVS